MTCRCWAVMRSSLWSNSTRVEQSFDDGWYHYSWTERRLADRIEIEAGVCGCHRRDQKLHAQAHELAKTDASSMRQVDTSRDLHLSFLEIRKVAFFSADLGNHCGPMESLEVISCPNEPAFMSLCRRHAPFRGIGMDVEGSPRIWKRLF